MYKRQVLDISSATTPVTRAGATGAEVTVSYVDVLIFDDTDNKSLAHYERDVYKRQVLV